MFKDFFQSADQKEKRNFFIKIAIIIIAFIIIAAAIIIIYFLITPKEETAIDNLSEYVSDLPPDDKKTIYSMLYRMIRSNSPNDTKIPTSGAIIRADSVTRGENQETNSIYGNFIVDLPQVHQSYLIQYEYIPTPNPDYTLLSSDRILVSCVPASDVIYEEFNCKDIHSEEYNSEELPLVTFLPYEGYTADNQKFTVGSAYYPENDDYIMPHYGFTLRIFGQTCGEDTLIPTFVQATSDWLSTINFNLDDYQYEFVDTCPHGERNDS